MTAVPVATTREPFRIWRQIRASLGVLVASPFLLIVLPVVFSMLAVAVSGAVRPSIVAAVNSDGLVGAIAIILLVLLGITVPVLFLAVQVQAAYDAHRGLRQPVIGYLRIALGRIVPMCCVLVPLNLLISIAGAIIPFLGLWVAAVYAAILPLLVVEDYGFGSFREANALSKNYRFAIVGFLLLWVMFSLACVTLLFFALAIIAGMGGADEFWMACTATIGVAWLITLGSVASVTIHARLRTIKDTLDAPSLAAVFA